MRHGLHGFENFASSIIFTFNDLEELLLSDVTGIDYLQQMSNSSQDNIFSYGKVRTQSYAL